MLSAFIGKGYSGYIMHAGGGTFVVLGYIRQTRADPVTLPARVTRAFVPV